MPAHIRFCDQFPLVSAFPTSDDEIFTADKTNDLIGMTDSVTWLASLHQYAVYHIAIDSYRLFIGAEDKFGKVEARYASIY